MTLPPEWSENDNDRPVSSGHAGERRTGEVPVVVVRPNRRRWLIAPGLALVAAAGVVLLRGSPQPAPTPHVPDVAMEGAQIRFSESFASRHHIASVTVVESQLAPTLAVTGSVRHDPRAFAAVGARTAGRVRRVYKIVGDRVKPGDVLADIESADLGRAQANAEALRARESVARANLEREERLAAARVTAAREAELAKADHESLRAERRAAEKAVAALGAQVGGEVGVVKLKSPIAGRVLAVKVSQGQTIEPSDTLVEIADLAKVWVELVVFEGDLARVHAGDAVDLATSAESSQVVHATLTRVSDVVDPVSRSAIARVELNNAAGELRPGQSISARIHGMAMGQRGVVVPKAAVTFVDSKPTVFLLVAPGLVEPHAVELAADDSEHVAVSKGLRAGDAIITSGLFALKSELFR